MVVMAGLKQAKRVSWARDGNLCKVRLFLSEDAPHQSGFEGQDHLQAKAAWLLHASGLGSDDSLPPGFEAPHTCQPKIEISQIPIIKWQCPPKLALNPEWQVVAGEESQEVATENHRQPGVLEAIYPRFSSIPPNPVIDREVQEASIYESASPLIPITAIEDEDSTEESAASSSTPVRLQSLPDVASTPQHSTAPDLGFGVQQLQSQPNVVPQVSNFPRTEQTAVAATMANAMAGMAPGTEPDVLAAASAAFTAIMKSCEEGSLVDRDLLIKILSNPGMVERLVTEYRVPKETPPPLAPQPVVTTPRPVATVSRPVCATPGTAPSPHTHINPVTPMSNPFQQPNMITPSALNLHHPVQMPTVPVPPPIRAPPPVKDANYYKSLIQLHGGEKQEALDQHQFQFSNVPNQFSGPGMRHEYHNNMMGFNNGGEAFGIGMQQQNDLKPKVSKPCAYFNTPRGCRHGASCLFQHDGSTPQRVFEQPKNTSKRMKIDREIAGRN